MHRIAIIGGGAVAHNHAKAVRKIKNAELAAVCDVLAEKADAFAKQYECKAYADLDEMLDKETADTLILAVPTFLHAEYTERCAARGRHILCEKPMEMSLGDAKKMAASRKKYGVKLMIAQVVRFWPGYTDAKRMYEAGELGDILMAVFSRSSTVPARGGWIIDPEKGRGAIQDMHIHDIDFITWLFGPADRVFSHAVKDYTGCFDHVVSSVTFKNGIKAAAEAAFSMKNSYPFSTFFRISGTRATLEYRYRATVLDIRANVTAQMLLFRQDSPVEDISPTDYDPYQKQLEYFLECVDKDKSPETVPLEDSLRSISLLDAVRASAASGEIEKVPEP
ncbi:MAG: Gfo/Idh/MocA family oxidoreductase [Treponema sp.]|jgi:predicted dehydrogenase|nr:Gfo/Idh/MocA family oxidoreductase [Treponema sp.]